MIRLENITKSFGKQKVLDHISLEFKENTITVIKGVSGCGKTTLLNILGGFIDDFEGSYLIDGIDVKEAMKHGYRKEIAYVFQQSLLFQHMNILDNLKFIVNDTQRILEYAKLFEVEHLLDKKVEEISNGERQRISIIRALLLNSKVLLCDEPSASLDLKQSLMLAKTIKKLKGLGKIIIIATHENCFDDICDQMIDLHYGKVKHIEQTEDLQVSEVKPQCIKKQPKYLKIDLQFVLDRAKKKGKLTNIVLSVIFLAFLFSISVILHFSSSYETYMYQQYPYQIINIEKDSMQRLFQRNDLKDVHYKLYKDIKIHENGYDVLPYYAYKDSALRIPRAIQYGTFPTSNNQVLVNQDYVSKVLQKKEIEEAIGEKVTIQGKSYEIAGILTKNETVLNTIEERNVYFDSLSKPILFCNYEELLTLEHEENETDSYMISIDVNVNSPTFETISDTVRSPWLSILQENITSVSFLALLVLICLVVVVFIIFIFLTNILYMELYTRKKEFGFLQLFSVSKRRIKRLVLLENINKIIIAIIVSDIAYVLLGMYIKWQYGFMFWLTLPEFIGLHLLVILYIMLLTRIPLHILLKKPIIELMEAE